MKKITGISHMTFIVKDIEKTTRLFKELFGAEEIYDSQERNFSYSREKFFLIAGYWIVLMEGEGLAEQTYNHIAFKIEASEFDDYLKKIQELGLEIKESRKRVAADAQSIYFYDYDNHLFELHTGTWQTRLAGYKNILDNQ